MEQDFSAQESLRLIEGMIAQAKRNFSRLSFYFLLWGVLLIGAMIAVYLLRDRNDGWGQGAPWGVAGIIGGVVSWVHGARQGKRMGASTPMDAVIGWVWSAFVVALLTTIFILASKGVDPGPMILLLTGFATFITGQVLRFRPLVLGGLVFWLCALVLWWSKDALLSTVIYCSAMLFGYIIPGLMLKRQEDGVRAA